MPRPPILPQIDWKTVVEWDKKYRIHVEATDEEYQPIPIARAEGDYLVTPDGTTGDGEPYPLGVVAASPSARRFARPTAQASIVLGWPASSTFLP